MAVPDFQSLMLPLLQVASDGVEHSRTEARDKLAAQFELISDDRAELLPSGKSSKFSNRATMS
jgi:restriction system protein